MALNGTKTNLRSVQPEKMSAILVERTWLVSGFIADDSVVIMFRCGANLRV